MLHLHFLGPPQIERDGQPVILDTRKATALLAYLAVSGQRHSRDALAVLLYPDYDQSRARRPCAAPSPASNQVLASRGCRSSVMGSPWRPATTCGATSPNSSGC